jgi:fimbrial isopeptide formation D2 family protein/LPXTG-motif cell wall-anchored protein
MKKTIQKLMAALLAVAMVCAMAIPAFATDGDATAAAATGTGSITIENAVTNQTYKIYRILNLEYHADTNSYRYTANGAWEDFILRENNNFMLDKETGAVTWINTNPENNGTAIQQIANSAGKYAEYTSNNVQEDGSAKANGITLTFSNLPLGWYLVVSDLVDLDKGALCSIGTTDPNAVIREKNSKPTIEKEVYEGDTLGYSNDAGIGDTVKFQTRIHVTDGNPTNYVLHDTMSNGLKFNEKSVTVLLMRDPKTGGSNYSGNLTPGTDYELVTSTSDTCTFEIKFLKPLKPYDYIQVDYSATVTSDAVIGTTGNDNKAVLTYGNNSTTTESSTTKTYVWEMGVRKFANLGGDDTNHALADAEFQLYKKDGDTQKYAKFVETSTTSVYKLTGWTNNATEAIKVKTPANGNITFEGLDAGTYYLEETKAPVGYNKLTAPITVVIDRGTLPTVASQTISYTVKYGDTTAADHVVRVENKAGVELPSTGGMGTTLFYVIGGGLMVAAIVLLVTKKRMENK